MKSISCFLILVLSLAHPTLAESQIAAKGGSNEKPQAHGSVPAETGSSIGIPEAVKPAATTSQLPVSDQPEAKSSIWLYLILGSAFGALLAIISFWMITRKSYKSLASDYESKLKKERATHELQLNQSRTTIENLKAGEEGVRLLDDEALDLLMQFQHDNKSLRDQVHSTATANEQVVNDFKQGLNNSLGGLVQSIRSVMEQAAGDAKKTRELLDHIVPLMEQKDAENKQLRKGSNVQLIGPLLESFFLMRDHLLDAIDHFIKEGEQSGSLILKYFEGLEREAAHAFHEVGLNEIKHFPGDDLSGVPQPHWKASKIAENTSDPGMHGRCARTKRIGYTFRELGSEHDGYVVRRAEIQLFSSEGAPQAQHEQPGQLSQTSPTPQNQIDNH